MLSMYYMYLIRRMVGISSYAMLKSNVPCIGDESSMWKLINLDLFPNTTVLICNQVHEKRDRSKIQRMIERYELGGG